MVTVPVLCYVISICVSLLGLTWPIVLTRLYIYFIKKKPRGRKSVLVSSAVGFRIKPDLRTYLQKD